MISILVEQGVGNAVEPFFFEKVMQTMVAETFADKVVPVRTAAVAAVKSVVQVATSWATPIFLPILLEQIKTAGKWQVKTGALAIIDQLVVSAPEQCANLMPDIIPVMVDAIWGAFCSLVSFLPQSSHILATRQPILHRYIGFLRRPGASSNLR